MQKCVIVITLFEQLCYCFVHHPTGKVKCRKNWSAYNGLCYRVYPNSFKFHAAVDKCQDCQGSQLAEIKSAAEEQFVQTLLLVAMLFVVYSTVYLGLQ